MKTLTLLVITILLGLSLQQFDKEAFQRACIEYNDEEFENVISPFDYNRDRQLDEFEFSDLVMNISMEMAMDNQIMEYIDDQVMEDPEAFMGAGMERNEFFMDPYYYADRKFQELNDNGQIPVELAKEALRDLCTL